MLLLDTVCEQCYEWKIEVHIHVFVVYLFEKTTERHDKIVLYVYGYVTTNGTSVQELMGKNTRIFAY